MIGNRRNCCGRRSNIGTRIENFDAPQFPAMEQVHERRNSASRGGIVLKLVAFEVAIESALARVLVLDPHFDEAGANVIGARIVTQPGIGRTSC